MSQTNLSSFIWSVADLLRGDYKQSEYGKVILPFTVLRRLDCVLQPTKEAVLKEKEKREAAGINPEPFLLKKSGLLFYNTSPLDIKKLMGDQDNIRENLFSYVQAFSADVRDIFECFDFATQIERLTKANLLYLVTEKFANIDLHPDKISNAEMGLVFEELIRKFAEISNETAGEHFTPREVIRLMVNLLFIEDDEALTKPGIVRSLYDPTAGTGGMLSVAEEHLSQHNKDARLVMYGQELNGESYAICKADMLIKGQDISQIIHGNTLSDDGLPGKHFDYMLSNPPFGVEWKKIQKAIDKEHEEKGFDGRFGPGLPRVSDGSLLFLLHLISKMRPVKDGGSRFGIVLNGSPLFTGGAGSGESEIRRYVLENDLLEAIIGLPTDMFYNTGISTYIWIVTNRKPDHRKSKVQLIDASSMFQKMRKSLGSKRKELSSEHIDEITRLFGEAQDAYVIDGQICHPGERQGASRRCKPTRAQLSATQHDKTSIGQGDVCLAFNDQESSPAASALPLTGRPQLSVTQRNQQSIGASALPNDQHSSPAASALPLTGMKAPISRIFRNEEFGYRTITVERPERDDKGNIVKETKGKNKGKPKPDSNLRDTENVPLSEDVQAYFQREVLPHAADAWIDEEKTKVGYEIPFNRHFYVFKPPRELTEIDAELKVVTDRILTMIGGLSK